MQSGLLTFMLTTPRERRTMLQLAHPTGGLNVDNLHEGLTFHLVPFVSTSPDGTSWLTAPSHRQLLQDGSTV